MHETGDTTFKDHFSGASEQYRRSRPGYPDTLFAWLASLAPATECTWDCATGTGQAAEGLAHHFRRVIATDASSTQIDNALAHPNIDYRVASAEHSQIADDSIDLITVAQALHWFDIPAFFCEAERVLKPRGILAVWSYNLLTIEPAIDAVVNHLYGPVLNRYWPAERRLVESGYRELDFPFSPVVAPAFAMEAQWNRHHLLDYLRTWSAVRRYQQEVGYDPVASCAVELAACWPEGEEKKTVRWPLALHVRQK